jgi:uncharacterized protein YkwD
MKRAAAVVLGLAVLVPVGSAVASPDVISEPLIALRGADRIGNAAQTEAPTAPAPTATPTPSVSAELQQVLDLVNVERTSRGLVPVRFSAQLNEAALAHTQRQASDGTIFHQDPRDGSSPGDRISQTGYEFSTWGENVAAGYPTPAAVMQGWMNSNGHCQNILNPAFTEMGVGYVTGGERYNQFWTQAFARPRGVDRPAGTFNSAWC